MSQQPGGPQGQNFGQNNQQQNNPQGGHSPSAYSAPQPGQPGQPRPPGQPGQAGMGGYPQGAFQQPNGMAALFSTNFGMRATSSLVKLIMLLGVIAFGIYAGYALFDLLTLLTADYGPGGIGIVTAIIHFAYRVAIAMVLLGLLRIILEYFSREDKKVA